MWGRQKYQEGFTEATKEQSSEEGRQCRVRPSFGDVQVKGTVESGVRTPPMGGFISRLHDSNRSALLNEPPAVTQLCVS